MQKKIRVGVFFGGKSAEHEVSIQSAKNIVQALDKNKYEVILIGIDKTGIWHLVPNLDALYSHEFRSLEVKNSHKITMLPYEKGTLLDLDNSKKIKIDVAFPILHGPNGEDGTIQGLFQLAGIPYVGANVLGSAIGMDKIISKKLLKEAGINTAKFVYYENKTIKEIKFEEIKKKLKLPFFVKPANLGSSVGISKIKSKNDFSKAVNDALKYSKKIIFEEFIEGREIECSVLGNENPKASLPGEIVVKAEFYCYKTKYVNTNNADLIVPAKLPKNIVAKVQKTAIETYKILCCSGFARVDFFLKNNGEVFVNEINTLPGFTNISMYPKLWEASGIKYAKLIEKIISLALSVKSF